MNIKQLFFLVLLFLSCVTICFFVYLPFRLEASDILWSNLKPSIYYVELREFRHSEENSWRLIIQDEELVMTESIKSESSEIQSYPLTALFEVVRNNCVGSNNCVELAFNNTHFFVERLVIYDWQGIEVLYFESCENLAVCEKNSA